MSNGCNDCKHHKHTEDCLIGNTEGMNAWWSENGSKTRNDVITDMDCFEPTDSAVALDKMIRLAREITAMAK